MSRATAVMTFVSAYFFLRLAFLLAFFGAAFFLLFLAAFFAAFFRAAFLRLFLAICITSFLVIQLNALSANVKTFVPDRAVVQL
jgi:hypothetical protein